MNDLVNINDIKRYVNNKIFKNAVSIESEQKIVLKVKFNKTLNYYKVTCKIKTTKSFEVSVNLKHNERSNCMEIKDSSCQCIVGDRCEHIASLLINLSKYKIGDIELLTTPKNESQTSKEILMLEQQILDRFSLKSSYSEPIYELLPIVVFNKGKIYLEFKIGNKGSHLYSVSDVYDFYQMFETQQVYDYSFKFSCIHKRRYLDEKVKGLNDFLFAKILNNKNIIENFDFNLLKNTTKLIYDKRYIEITENDLLLLTNFLKSEKVHVKTLKNKKINEYKLKSKLGDLVIYLNITKGKKNYELEAINETQYTFYGNDIVVSILKDNLIITNIKNNLDSKFLNLILNQKLKISNDDFDRVYDNVLKKRLKFIKLYPKCDFCESSIQSVSLNVYIDVNKRGHLEIIKKMYRGTELIKIDNQLNKRQNILALNKFLEKFETKNKYVIKNIDDIYDFYTNGVDQLYEYADEVFLSQEFKKVNIIKKPKIGANINVENSKLKFNINIDGKKIEDLKKLMADFKEKKKFYRLENGDFIQFENDDYDNVLQMLNELKKQEFQIENDEFIIEKSNAMYVDEFIQSNNNVQKSISYKKLIKSLKEFEFDTQKDIVLNNNHLRDYQVYGHNFLMAMAKNNFGAILADDMGLGKTIQVISVLTSSKKCNLVVCPSSLVYNWKNELEKFAPKLKVEIVKDDKVQRIKILKDNNKYNVLITSYDTLKRDLEEYSNLNFECMIIDEAQYIKNPSTKGAIAVKQIKSDYRYALSGTPIENNLTELWSIFDFVMPGYLKTYYHFHKNYEVPIVKIQDNEVLEQLKRKVNPFILRRMKKDVLKELPPKIETVLYCDLDEKQKDLYDAHILQITKVIDNKSEEDFSNNKIEILSMLMKLRQICCDPKLMSDDKYVSAKLEMCIELIKNCVLSKRKILLFSQFTSMLEIIEQRLNEEGITNLKLTGKTKSKDRLDLVDQFNSDETSVFLISLKAGGTGLNLTTADVVIHYDPWWNVSGENQATDRAYRIGQKNKVNVYKLICKKTIEEQIIKIQDDKKQLSDKLISSNVNPLSKLNKKDFMKMLIE